MFFRWLFGSLLVLAAALLALRVARFSALPQFAAADDVVSVAFGDAREVISRSAITRADSYFHGGVDMEGCECHGHHECGHDHGEEHEEEAGDPWHWINSHIRAPQEHRHLEGAAAVEMLPWFWAAVKVNPHNVEAWSTAWYIAKHTMHDEALAWRVIAEAKAKNPDSVEIAFTEGRAYYDGGHGDLVSAKRCFERARALGEKKSGGDVSKLTEKEADAYRFAGNYLDHIHL